MKRHKKKRKGNNLLIEEVKYTGEINNPTKMDLIYYQESGFKEEDLQPMSIPILKKTENTVWLRINGLNNVDWIKQIADSICLPQLGLQDVLQPQIIPRIENYDNLIQVNMKHQIFHDNDQVEIEQITLILGKGFVISLQETDNSYFADIIEAIKQNTVHLRTRKADYLFLLLLNHLLSEYVDQMNKLEDTYEGLEEELLDSYNTDDNFRNKLKVQRGHYQILKQSIFPLKDCFIKIKENDDNLISEKNEIYINAVYEQFNYLTQSLDICRETFDALVNLFLSNNDLRMNEIMKRLTVISAIFIPLTFLAGVWGMNYQVMPELSLPYGYLLAWFIMIAVASLTWGFIRKRKWY